MHTDNQHAIKHCARDNNDSEFMDSNFIKRKVFLAWDEAIKLQIGHASYKKLFEMSKRYIVSKLPKLDFH